MDGLVDECAVRSASAAARQICRRDGGSSAIGWLPTFFLPRHKRDGLFAVWAFARLIRQALATEAAAAGAGDCCSGAAGVAPLLKDRIDLIYAGHIDLPLPQFRDANQWTLLAMEQTVRRFEVPRRLWLDLIDGLAALRGVQRIATWRSLDAHLSASGGNMGRIVAAVLGATHSDAGQFAAAVGRGAALAGIVRNLKLELSRGRLLLPLEDLARFRYSERDVLTRTVNDSFRALARHELERARSLLHEGAAGTCWLAGDGSRMAAASFVAGQLAAIDEMEGDVDRLLTGGVGDSDTSHGEAKRPSLGSQLRALPVAWRIARRQAAETTTPATTDPR